MKIKDSYPTIERMKQKVYDAFATTEPKIAKVFDACISNTIQKTISVQEDGSVFVITGDIPAMWLRDSACQLLPYIRFAKEDAEIGEILIRLSQRQMKCIQIDPYANAFNAGAEGVGWIEDKTDMKPELWERKYEIDSLCYPIYLSWKIWKDAGLTVQFDENWKNAAQIVLQTLRIEQDHENKSTYRFERPGAEPIDTLVRDGLGAPVKSNIGLIWSGFRPSDDVCTYGYLIPSNMLASVVLSQVAEIAEVFYNDTELAKEAAIFADEVRTAIETYAVVQDSDGSSYYAYEVDGFGQQLIMDDANVPNLMSASWFGYCDRGNQLYQTTREMALSHKNPYYYEGSVMQGVGSPHTKPQYVWDLSLAMKGLTTNNKEEQLECIRRMAYSDAGTNLMHESIHKDDSSLYTREWFSWANAMFCELVIEYLNTTVVE